MYRGIKETDKGCPCLKVAVKMLSSIFDRRTVETEFSKSALCTLAHYLGVQALKSLLKIDTEFTSE